MAAHASLGLAALARWPVDEYPDIDGASDLDVPAWSATAELRLGDWTSFLRGIEVVFLWGLMEALILDIAGGWLRTNADARQRPAVVRARAEVKLVPEDGDGWRETAQVVAYRARDRRGPQRFEKMVAAIGLRGDVDSETMDELVELWAVRNALVHGDGRADRQLVERCPDMGLEVGDPLIVGPTTPLEYVGACTDYTLLLIERLALAGKYPEIWAYANKVE